MADPDPIQLTDAEKTKAARAKMILWTVMVLFTVVPILVYWLTQRAK